MNYEAERAMNQKRLRMDGEPGHGVVQGNGLPLNYMDNGHQIPYQPYAGAYNTHYPPPDAFAAYGPPPPGGYAPQNLSYAPPAHQNYPHHQSFPPQQPPQAQLHMQSHMVQGYGDVGMHKPAWPPQPHLLPPLDPQKALDIKQLKPEIKLEPTDPQKRPHPENEMMGGDLDQPKIKIKTDIFKPDELAHRPEVEKPHELSMKPAEAVAKPVPQEEIQPVTSSDGNVADKPPEVCKVESKSEIAAADTSTDPSAKPVEKKEGDVKSEAFGSPDRPKASTTPGKALSPGAEPKKRGRPKGSTNKPKPPGASPHKATLAAPTAGAQIRGPAAALPRPAPIGRPRGTGYQYAIRPFRKDFSGIQFRRRWSDDCLDSSHIPNEVYFGDVPVSMEVLFNYYDANAERERLAAQAAHIAAQKAAAAKLQAAKLQARGLLSTSEVLFNYYDANAERERLALQAAKLQARGLLSTSELDNTKLNAIYGGAVQLLRRQRGKERLAAQAAHIAAQKAAAAKLQAAKLQARGLLSTSEVTTVDSSSSDDSSGSSGSDSEDSDDDAPLKKGPGRPRGSTTPKAATPGGGRRGRPPVPPELREPGITDMKKFCKAAGIRLDYKKLVEGCTKNKERVQRMLDLLIAAGLQGKPTLEKCQALKQNKQQRKKRVERAPSDAAEPDGEQGPAPRRMTRGQTGVKPRQKIVISSDEEDDTPSARRTLSKLRSCVEDESDSN
ncbi:hypothetical protein JYU34_012234 [Plutella xylostella]|uniref:HIRA-interacting protein 3 n=1 Tax=Plutella xylostella TaxID=51655 RepID=A0ABQ7QER4_PLUXY|nr:hypothetical protein JYU34_012234 [Plutella xylostella]